MKAATRQFASQSARNSIITHDFHKGYGQNSVEHEIQQFSCVSQITSL